MLVTAKLVEKWTHICVHSRNPVKAPLINPFVILQRKQVPVPPTAADIASAVAFITLNSTPTTNLSGGNMNNKVAPFVDTPLRGRDAKEGMSFFDGSGQQWDIEFKQERK